MIRTVKPKNARSKRALERRESKLVENTKQALFIPGQTSNKILHDITVDLAALKKPDVKRFSKRNDIHPFEDASTLEFLSEKNDCSLLVLSTNSKKRRNNLTFIRTFGYKIYDMIELQVVDNFKLFTDFQRKTKHATISLGLKPMFVFQGAAFETHPVYKQVKSLFLDFFRGTVTELQDVAGLQHVIAVTVQGDFQDGEPLPNVLFRVYKLRTYRSEQGGRKLPRVELDEVGPRLDFKIGRIHTPSADLVKEAHKKAKSKHHEGEKNVKNVETDLMGDKLGRIHVGKQELGKLQTRKLKGLKSKYDQGSDNDNDNESIADFDEAFVTASEIAVDEPAQKKRKT